MALTDDGVPLITVRVTIGPHLWIEVQGADGLVGSEHRRPSFPSEGSASDSKAQRIHFSEEVQIRRMMIGSVQLRSSLRPSAALGTSSPVSGSRGKACPTNVSAKTPNSCPPESMKLPGSSIGESDARRSRREALRGLLLCSTAFSLTQYAGQVLAEEVKNGDSSAGSKDDSVFGGIMSLLDPDETTKSGKKLPKAYLKSARGVVTKLRDSFSGDSKNESEFRRNADSAKEAIRDYVANWRGSKDLSTEESYQALEKALRTLGEFYSKKGPRAVLPEDVRTRVLEALQTADDAL
ncbi:hypothetical protein MPTK1_6g19720 [Marchantia polymorpha subsp. ruderalis]|uniref:Uncharacterized protein n=2 Tax=Marchantia polymorpha TaxID=3197 RepID=A0A176VUU0_MARPO|nr:hypothetical protein AXG93_2402s1210 [Marchantia polymorpha subsp. ruderalis]PTQ39433.1 hypothetical protein MARPO_0045s0091 [Marchantia polymorpha]PTQ39434.1 hypothetical protein MARPO_0045s0091 [Marchantia polymorpha]BBN15454.1 hypothetical protein Mp_6g19720 [Marchantia polymorpha subsp. ruderalis]BBN15455.1 hypothetical protein Mp_6g19720 [Marchantia polymorpha subsp. ruderalis]|eukprot:PTQ39433.1 hypothetical protein MARPO_0045s0091 [Marchantia polymorpha]